MNSVNFYLLGLIFWGSKYFLMSQVYVMVISMVCLVTICHQSYDIFENLPHTVLHILVTYLFYHWKFVPPNLLCLLYAGHCSKDSSNIYYFCYLFVLIRFHVLGTIIISFFLQKRKRKSRENGVLGPQNWEVAEPSF